jgi:hypothetical protein
VTITPSGAVADEQLEFDKPIAVLDTNVVLEAVSCVDLVKLYNNQPDIDPLSPEATLRRQKARESLLLSIYLNSIKATTYSIFESMRITVREVDPNANDEFENHAMIIWTHYVKDKVLPDWVMTSPSSGDDEPTGNRADALLVERAKEHGVPLISHEGLSVAGIDPKSGIRRKAAAAGVTIVTPKEFYGNMDELLQAALFMKRYADGAEGHIRSSTHPGIMRESMLWLDGYYRHILYGITKGRSEPLPIRL